jgi:hypothetical protein
MKGCWLSKYKLTSCTDHSNKLCKAQHLAHALINVETLTGGSDESYSKSETRRDVVVSTCDAHMKTSKV